MCRCVSFKHLNQTHCIKTARVQERDGFIKQSNIRGVQWDRFFVDLCQPLIKLMLTLTSSIRTF